VDFFIVACSLSIARGSQGTESCVLEQVLGKRTFQSLTNGKNRTLLGIVKGIGLVFRLGCLETRCLPWRPISMGAKQL
jgi:hypothetical protein